MIQINYRDARALYEQIHDQLRRLIVSGGLRPQEKLPSVRTMATQLAVNPNTMQRAYALLEQEGYIYSIAGRGSFVAENSGESHRQDLENQFKAMAVELRLLGHSTQSLEALIQEEKPIHTIQGDA